VSIASIIIVFFGGILSASGCEPLGWWIAPWFGLSVLWWSLSKNKSYRNSIILGLTWGLGYHGFVLSWILGIHPMTWLGVPWFYSLLIAMACWLLVSIYGASLVVFWSLGLTFLYKRTPDHHHIILGGVALWLALEGIYSYTPLWWSSLSLTQSPHNLEILQLGSLTGPSAVVALLVTINGLFAHYLSNSSKKRNIYILLAIVLYSLAWLVGFSMHHRPISDREQGFKIGLIQGNIANEIKLYPAGFIKAIDGYRQGYEELAQQGAQMVITPETALPFFWDDLKSGSFYKSVVRAKIPVLLGGFGRSDGGYTNSLFMLNPDAQIMGQYDKTKLVPLGEYIPFEEILGRFIQRLSPLKNRLQPGQQEQILNSPFGKVIIGICYESAYSELFRRQTRAGGVYIVTASNDAHYSKAMPAQHHGQDVMRAIENDRWTARVTNTGYSAIITPRGDLVWKSSLNEYQTHSDMIYTRSSQTFYVRFGDWLSWSLLFLASLDLFFISKKQSPKIKETQTTNK